MKDDPVLRMQEAIASDYLSFGVASPAVEPLAEIAAVSVADLFRGTAPYFPKACLHRYREQAIIRSIRASVLNVGELATLTGLSKARIYAIIRGGRK